MDRINGSDNVIALGSGFSCDRTGNGYVSCAVCLIRNEGYLTVGRDHGRSLMSVGGGNLIAEGFDFCFILDLYAVLVNGEDNGKIVCFRDIREFYAARCAAVFRLHRINGLLDGISFGSADTVDLTDRRDGQRTVHKAA